MRSLPRACPVCSFLIENLEAHVCPNCGAILSRGGFATPATALLYSTGIGAKEMLCVGSGFLTLISLVSPWLLGFTPVYVGGSIRSKITAELTGLQLLPSHPLLTLLLVTFLAGVFVLLLSLSPVTRRVGEPFSRKTKKLLFLAAIPLSGLAVFGFTATYESGTAIIMDSTLLSARSSLGPGFSLALFSILGFLGAAILDWIRD